ncbi:histone-like nucleoid-structuring protein Lsr2 [Nocardia goodfellowii]
MVRKLVVTLIDDYDGRSKADETVTFAVDGIAYEMDLSVRNAGELRGLFEQWTRHARKVTRVPRGGNSSTRSTVDRDETAAIRAWARKQGHKVSSRGRISAKLATAYDEASS